MLLLSTILTAACLFLVCAPVLGANCPKGWTAHGFSCYVIIHQPLNWFDAMNACIAVEGALAEIDSLEEDNFLASLMLKEHDGDAWIGLEDFLIEHDFVWISSQAGVEFAHWDVGQPSDNGAENQDCGKLRSNGRWDDDNCYKLHWALCERSMDPALVG